MAYNAANEEREQLYFEPKNNRGEYIKVDKITNKNSGSVSVDIRNYFTNDNNEVCPTSKGIRINTESLFGIMEALAGALEENEVMELADALSEIYNDSDDEDEAESETEDEEGFME